MNSLKYHTVLFVENEKGIRDNFCDFLSLLFKEVHSAPDGAEGLKLYRQHKPDLIITDIKMPYMSGIELVKAIREEDQKTEIVIVSAHTDIDFLLESIPLKLIEYIVKPITEEKLFGVFEHFIEKQTSDIPGFTLDKEKSQVAWGGMECALTLREKVFLERLIDSGRIVTYYEIEAEVWDGDPMSQNALRLFVKNLRKKLPEGLIKNIPNQGYLLNSDYEKPLSDSAK